MKKINILVLIDKFDYHGSYINGPSRNYSWLLSRLDKKRFNVYVYALRKKGKSHHLFEQEGVNVTYLNLGKYNPFAPLLIMWIIWANKIDILHLQGYASTTFGRIAGTICRKPRIIKEEWVDPHMSKLHSLFEHLLSPLTTRAIAISEYSLKFLAEKKGLRKDKTILIRNGIPLDQFRDVDETLVNQTRKKLDISEDVKAIGIVGMLHENKGHKYFIEAASLLSKTGTTAKFFIIGDGELRGELEALVSQLGLEDLVKFLGHQTNMPAILKVLDILVVASISETLSMSLLEAMAAERAIIATDSGGPSEIVRDGITGLIVPVRDPKAIAESIEYLIHNPIEAKTIARNAKEDSERFDIKLTVEEIQSVYEQTYFGNVG